MALLNALLFPTARLKVPQALPVAATPRAFTKEFSPRTTRTTRTEEGKMRELMIDAMASKKNGQEREGWLEVMTRCYGEQKKVFYSAVALVEEAARMGG
jgi:hypothetical protein